MSSARVRALSPPTASSTSRRNAPPAPGTVGIDRVTSYTRRSTLKPTTYSMCCRRASRVSRLAILTLPDTAPTVGSAKGCTSSRTVSGSNRVSPSTMTIRSCAAAATPALSAADLPPLGSRRTRTPGRESRSTTSAVPSSDPSSITRISTGWSLAAAERTVAAMLVASLYAGMSTDTGRRTGSPQHSGCARRYRACRRARTSSTSNRATVSAPTTIRAHFSTVIIALAAVTSAVSADPETRSPTAAGCSASIPTASLTVVNR